MTVTGRHLATIAVAALLTACPRQQSPVWDGKEEIADGTTGAPSPVRRPDVGAAAGSDRGASGGSAPKETAPAPTPAPAGGSGAVAVREGPAPRSGGGVAERSPGRAETPDGPKTQGAGDGAHGPATAVAADLDLGRAVWTKKCKTCHGADGRARTTMGRKHGIADATQPDWKRTWTTAKIVEVVRDGVPGTKMRAFGRRLSEAEIAAVAAYMRSL